MLAFFEKFVVFIVFSTPALCIKGKKCYEPHQPHQPLDHVHWGDEKVNLA